MFQATNQTIIAEIFYGKDQQLPGHLSVWASHNGYD